MSLKINDRVRVVLLGEWFGQRGTLEVAHPTWDVPYGVRFEGEDTLRWFARDHLALIDGSVAIDRLNAEADCYRKEAQEARALQRKFYDETQELRRLLAQVTAERDAANQQCACAIRQLDDLRACLKALAR